MIQQSVRLRFTVEDCIQTSQPQPLVYAVSCATLASNTSRIRGIALHASETAGAESAVHLEWKKDAEPRDMVRKKVVREVLLRVAGGLQGPSVEAKESIMGCPPSIFDGTKASLSG